MSGLGQTSSRGGTPSSAAASHASGSVAVAAGGTIVLKDSPQLTTKVLENVTRLYRTGHLEVY